MGAALESLQVVPKEYRKYPAERVQEAYTKNLARIQKAENSANLLVEQPHNPSVQVVEAPAPVSLAASPRLSLDADSPVHATGSVAALGFVFGGMVVAVAVKFATRKRDRQEVVEYVKLDV